MEYLKRLLNGIIKENPTFVLMLGMCPTLAVTSSAVNGLGMGLSTMAVLICSNVLISLFRKVIPGGVRMPAYIVIVASLVTIVQFLMQAYLPGLSKSLGVYIPLIVVNCIILGRAEGFASKNTPLLSLMDAIGMGLGFTIGLTLIGTVREILGEGKIFGVIYTGVFVGVEIIVLVLGVILFAVSIYRLVKKPKSILFSILLFVGFIMTMAGVISLTDTPSAIFIMAPGAFLVLAFFVAIMNVVREKMEALGKPLAKPSGCLAGNCAGCPTAALCKSNPNECPKEVQS